MKFILIFNDVPRLFYLLTPFIIFLSFFFFTSISDANKLNKIRHNVNLFQVIC